MEVMSLFYSSSGEGYLEKYYTLFEKEATQVGEVLDVKFNIIFWKKNIPGGLGKSAQDVVNEYVKGKYEIYFGVLGTKFGSGTESEYRRAVEDHVKDGSPVVVLFGFCEEKINPYEVDDTFSSLKAFRDDIGKPGTYGLSNLYFTFATAEDFTSAVRREMTEAVRKIKGRIYGGAKI